MDTSRSTRRLLNPAAAALPPGCWRSGSRATSLTGATPTSPSSFPLSPPACGHRRQRKLQLVGAAWAGLLAHPSLPLAK